jgi:hypothetical protein
VLRLAGLAERKDRRVLDDPDFIWRFCRTGNGEILHGLEGRLVFDPPERLTTADSQGNFDHRVSGEVHVQRVELRLGLATTVQVRLR